MLKLNRFIGCPFVTSSYNTSTDLKKANNAEYGGLSWHSRVSL